MILIESCVSALGRSFCATKVGEFTRADEFIIPDDLCRDNALGVNFVPKSSGIIATRQPSMKISGFSERLIGKRLVIKCPGFNAGNDYAFQFFWKTDYDAIGLGEVCIDLAGLAKGTYVLKIPNTSGSMLQKVVVVP